jgi:hypothetical protein
VGPTISGAFALLFSMLFVNAFNTAQKRTTTSVCFSRGKFHSLLSSSTASPASLALPYLFRSSRKSRDIIFIVLLLQTGRHRGSSKYLVKGEAVSVMYFFVQREVFRYSMSLMPKFVPHGEQCLHYKDQ